ncbi:MAG: MATE family efflux transporter [Eubacteriaceae bacterium]|jgi:putative MATE family efflux protein|nr:MATE family efflux transporter [Eubacteriaceae bacterium]
MGDIKENKMGTMPIRKLLLSMSWPSILSMTIQALYNIVDSIFVSYTGEDGLTALTLIFPVQMLMISVGVGTAIGVNSLIARRLGARRFSDANEAASCGFKLSFVNWAIFAVIGIFFSQKFMAIFSKNEYIIEAGASYLRIVLVVSVFLFVDITAEKMLQATGNMVTPMLAALVGQIINVILDPILIFGLLGAPKLGVPGAAVATVIGQCGEAVWISYILFKKDHDIKITFRGRSFRKQIIKDIYAVGAPSMIMQSIASVMQLGMNMILILLSPTAVAVMGVYGRLQSFAFMPCFGLNQGLMPIIGYNFGARDRHRIEAALQEGYKVSFIIMGCALIIFQLFPHQLMTLFNASPNMYAIGIPALRTISWCFLPAAFGIVCGGFFGATAHGFISLWGSMLRQLVGILPLAYVFARIGGIKMVWWAFPLAEIIGLIYMTIMIRRVYSREIKVMEKPVND